MNDISAVLMLPGVMALDVLGVFIFALIGAVVVIDVWIGRKRRPVFVFAIVQVVALAIGMAWAVWVGINHDIAGPYAWALVIGLWLIATVLFHLWYLFYTAKGAVKRG